MEVSPLKSVANSLISDMVTQPEALEAVVET